MGVTIRAYLKSLLEANPGKHIILIWDNAPCHRLKEFEKMENITIV